MNRKFTSATLMALVAMSSVVFTHCSKKDIAPAESATPSAITETLAYTGTGSQWDWTLDIAGTFTATETTLPMTINGTYTRLASGFIKMTVVSSTGTNAPVAGNLAYGLEVPGVALLVKPVSSSESEVITMVAKGKCPTADFSANWIKTQFNPNFDMTSTTSNNGDDAFGTFGWTQATGTGSVATRYTVAGYTAAAGTQNMAGTCTAGLMTTSGGASMYLTAQGGALIKTASGDAMFAMPNGTITQAALAGNYAGLLFDDYQSSGKVRPMVGVATAAGLLSADAIDVETGTKDPLISGSLQMDAVNSPSAGFIKATVTVGSKTGKMACMAAVNVASTEKNIIFCVGQSPGSNQHPFNLLFVSH